MLRTFIAVAVAGAFVLPMTSQASDGIVVVQAGGDTGAASHANPTGKGASTAGATSNRGRFEGLDKNHDGYISRDEAKDADELNTRFSELDMNNDDKLSREEYDAVSKSARGATGSTSATGKKSRGQPEGGGTSSTTK